MKRKKLEIGVAAALAGLLAAGPAAAFDD